ncbi:hypothetical protein BZG02_09840 [Labilibaculum filiforme]|uniref:DUF4131 domain-containing protein n=1 Tax=Labilibaculum filiforme TaxID=1940526 RepID=A0A2N3HYB7_9BACT|nr:hypothetical protein [Labilibaculum filiforme]PKQ63060.1 hypothetical protein BZG02_09840 [Labilibaculum filiforme]
MKKINKLLVILIVLSIISWVLTIQNLFLDIEVNWIMRVVIRGITFILTFVFISKTKYKKYNLYLASALWLILILISFFINKEIRHRSNRELGGNVNITVLVHKNHMGKSGCEGTFQVLKNKKIIVDHILGNVQKRLFNGDTVLFIESIKFPGQYDVLNYFPSSDEISRAKNYKYYYKGEYVHSLPK